MAPSPTRFAKPNPLAVPFDLPMHLF